MIVEVGMSHHHLGNSGIGLWKMTAGQLFGVEMHPTKSLLIHLHLFSR
jgi:hypothetical protein